MTGDLSRRSFLTTAAAGAVLGATGACTRRSGSGAAQTSATPRRENVRILLASHPVPGYDRWFDNAIARTWGEEQGISVAVDRVPLGELQTVAAAEVAAQQGHDLVGFLSPPAIFEEQVIDHRAAITEAEAALGPMLEVARRSTFNPLTRRHFAFSDSWAPAPVLWRRDLWQAVGATPASWAEIREAAPALKARGHPIGIGLSQELDSNTALISLMAAFGSFVQDQASRVVIDRPETVDAVRFGAELFRTGMTHEVLAWDPTSNNRYLQAGRGSLVVNPITVLRAIAEARSDVAAHIAVSPAPRGPVGVQGQAGAVSTYAIWRFARNPEAAQRFLVWLAGKAADGAVAGGFANLPSFAGVASGIEARLNDDPVLRSADAGPTLAGADEWSINLGYPGSSNPAIADVLNRSLIPQMFARVALGRDTAADAVADTGRQIEALYNSWRRRGLV